MHHVYSDFSATKYASGYAYLVIKYVDKKPCVLFRGSKSSQIKDHTILGEVMGVVAALKNIDDGEDVTVHSDVENWDRILERPLNIKVWRIQEPIKQLKQEIRRFGKIKFRFIEKDKRNFLYWWCHHKARYRSRATSFNSKSEIELDASLKTEFNRGQEINKKKNEKA